MHLLALSIERCVRQQRYNYYKFGRLYNGELSKKIMRQLLDHRDNLNEYVNSLYANEIDEEDYYAYLEN